MNDAIPTFDYFVVRLNRTDSNPDRLTGLVERLGSGEKKPFDTAEHLARLISGWRARGFTEDAVKQSGRARAGWDPNAQPVVHDPNAPGTLETLPPPQPG